ncbi:DUF808 domain-containing protein [Paracoccus sp. p4-l81]|uniref:DUF808 domain-containing protein n=1 Tax=unclassified Paracoccus (in: a-proteobacteria) TaxID=2688777 RepID=UPI0035BA4FD3
MSGLLALLDDVAGIAKVAAASVDDVASMTVKAGAKVSGVVIDDAAVTPRYVTGFSADRELPIIWKIAKGSIFNKLVILLPIALLLKAFAPWAIAPLLMIGGAYLCFEGAEKVWHWLNPHTPHADGHVDNDVDPVRLEEERVAGAIKTDFILSAEIMTIALATLPEGQTVWMQGGVLFAVAVAITALVYGGVALIVKMDDIGLHMAENGRRATASLGRGILRFMPGFMKALTIIGTAAMIWVGGNIVVHGLHELGVHEPYNTIHHLAEGAAHAVPQAAGFVNWLVTAALDGVIGLILGLALIPVATHVINPLIGKLTGKAAAH